MVIISIALLKLALKLNKIIVFITIVLISACTQTPEFAFTPGFQPIKVFAPIYPDKAQSMGIEGRVVVVFTITEKGRVKEASVLSSDPMNIFNSTSIEAILQFEFEPRDSDVRDVKYIFNFNLR